MEVIEKVCLKELSDNFFVSIVPSEYDPLLTITHNIEIVIVLVEATKMENPLEVVFSNRLSHGHMEISM